MEIRPPLDGVRVVELGGNHSAAFATRVLADFGAEVVKVESAAGDPVRAEGPRISRDDGALFEFLNWNKVSWCSDAAAAGDELLAVIAAADLVVAGDDAAVLAEWGLDIARVLSARAGLVLTTVTPFGATGPHSWWRGSDLVVQAAGGLMAFSGTFELTPLKRGLRQVSYTAGLTAAYASLAALLSARRSGRGVHVDVSQQEVVAAELILNIPTYTFMGATQGRRAASKDPFTGEPIPAKDGYVTVQTNTWTTLPMFADLLDEPRLCDERFSTRQKRGWNAEALTQILTEALRDVSGRELFERASAANMLAGFAQTAEQLLSCPQLAARDAFIGIKGSDGAYGPWQFPAVLADFTPALPRRVSRAPRLGSGGDEVLRRWQEAPRPAPDARPAPCSRPRPLEGLRVLDLSSVVAVPLIGAMLSDLGASVIKLEPPNRLDQGRGPMFGPLLNNTQGEDPWNRSGAFHSLNRGKRSIAVDLKSERGREIALELIRDADVLLDNFTPRVMRGWGLTYERLAEINPRLVMVSNTGYGSSGPWSAFKAQGTTLEATMGVGTYSGYRGSHPTKVGQSYPDFIACWTGLSAIFAALVGREHSGRGRRIDIGMYQLGPSMIPEAFVHSQAGHGDYGRMGNDELDSLLSAVVPAAGEDRWLTVSVPDAKTWAAAATVVPGMPPQPDGEIHAAGAAADSAGAALEALRAWAAARPAIEAAEELQSAGVPAAPVNDARDLLLDPHLFVRGMYEDVDLGPEAGVTPVLSRGFRWHGAEQVAIQYRGPRFAEHNDEVLAECGLDAAARDQLRADGVIVDEPVDPPRLLPFDLVEGVRNHLYREVDPDFRDRLTQGRAALRAIYGPPGSGHSTVPAASPDLA